jgi:hypothetical protein
MINVAITGICGFAGSERLRVATSPMPASPESTRPIDASHQLHPDWLSLTEPL